VDPVIREHLPPGLVGADKDATPGLLLVALARADATSSAGRVVEQNAV
jgi:hypothetical protein